MKLITHVSRRNPRQQLDRRELLILCLVLHLDGIFRVLDYHLAGLLYVA